MYSNDAVIGDLVRYPIYAFATLKIDNILVEN